MDRLERLLNLLAALIDTERPLRREEIHTRVPGYPDRDDSFRRQFERDKETLRQMGVPIAVEPVLAHSPEQGTGYRVHQRDYALPDPGLTTEEITALHLAASSVRFLGEDAKGAISKLGGVPGHVAENGAAGVDVPGLEHLAPCFAAIAGNRTLTFSYKGESRRVVPARLSFRSGRWYLAAWDLDREAERPNFRLDRMKDPEVGPPAAEGTPLAVADRERLAPWELGDEEPVTARLRVDADQADLAVRAVGGRGTVEKAPDGEAVIELQVRNAEFFRNFVLDFLDHAEVISPPELRAQVVSWLRSVAADGSTQ